MITIGFPLKGSFRANFRGSIRVAIRGVMGVFRVL